MTPTFLSPESMLAANHPRIHGLQANNLVQVSTLQLVSGRNTGKGEKIVGPRSLNVSTNCVENLRR